MKKVMSLGMSFLLLSLVFSFIPESKEPQEIKTEVIETHILTDEELSRLYSYKDDVNCDTCLLISQEDAERLMKIAVVEDPTDIESQAYVMACVLNRVESPDFPDTIQSVIEQKGQFSTVSNGKYANAQPNVDSHYALALIESGQITTDALYFEADWAGNTWQSHNLTYIETIGGTKYYTN